MVTYWVRASLVRGMHFCSEIFYIRLEIFFGLYEIIRDCCRGRLGKMISELISNPWEFWFFRSGLANSILIRNPQPQKPGNFGSPYLRNQMIPNLSVLF